MQAEYFTNDSLKCSSVTKREIVVMKRVYWTVCCIYNIDVRSLTIFQDSPKAVIFISHHWSLWGAARKKISWSINRWIFTQPSLFHGFIFKMFRLNVLQARFLYDEFKQVQNFRRDILFTKPALINLGINVK